MEIKHMLICIYVNSINRDTHRNLSTVRALVIKTDVSIYIWRQDIAHVPTSQLEKSSFYAYLYPMRTVERTRLASILSSKPFFFLTVFKPRNRNWGLPQQSSIRRRLVITMVWWLRPALLRWCEGCIEDIHVLVGCLTKRVCLSTFFTSSLSGHPFPFALFSIFNKYQSEQSWDRFVELSWLCWVALAWLKRFWAVTRARRVL